MRWWIVLLTLCGCAGSVQPGPERVKVNPARDEAAARLVEATARGDAAATRGLLDDEVELGGLWFEDTACRRQFPGVGAIRGSDRDALARCLAGLRLTKSERSSPYPDIAVLTYEPGIELEVLFGLGPRPKVRWIGYVSRRSLRDALPTITQRALEAHRTGGSIDLDEAARARIAAEHAANGLEHGAAWLKVCIDAGGAVTSVRARVSTSRALQEALAAAVAQWTFRPVILGGQPTPVCALMAHDYPTGAAPPGWFSALPLPNPPAHEAALVVPPTALKRLGGDTLLVPDDDAKMWIRRNRIDQVVGAFFFCVTPQGTVDIVETLRFTGVPRYDNRIQSGLRALRYAPFTVDGRPAPVCSSLLWIYSQS